MSKNGNTAKDVYKYYSSVEKTDIEWLWYPYIPYGKITLVEGDPGEGKSTFMLNVVSLLTRGLNMPDGFRTPEPVTVIYQCAEDSISDTIKPRLTEAGADCNRVAYIIDDDGSLNLEDSRIEKTIRNTGARLLILDPLQSFIPQDSDMKSASKMRSIMGSLAALAEKYNCAVVVIGHMNKASANKSLYRSLGSIDIPAIARSVLMICRDEDEPAIRYMIPIKSNLAPEGYPIGFLFDGSNGFKWLGRCDVVVPDEMVRSTACEKIDVEEWLTEELSEGPKTSADVLNHFIMLDAFTTRTLYSVKKKLNIKSFKIDNVWYWTLPEETENKDV